MANSGANKKRPKYDVELDDGINPPVGLMLVNGRGMNDPLAIQRSSFPRTSTKISSGQGKYDDLELPYKSIAQDNWVGGRASANLEDDTTRFMDSFRAWSEQEKQITNGGQETYCSQFQTNTVGTTYRYVYQSIPGKVIFTSLIGATGMLAHSFAPAAITIHRVGVIAKRVGTPDGNLKLALYDNGAVGPGSLVASVSLTTTDIPDIVSSWVDVKLSQAVSAATYWLVVSQDGGAATTANHWEVGVNPDASTGTKQSYHGIPWLAATYELYYRVYDDTDLKIKFFEYKRAIYAIDMQKNNRGYLFINGDRGAADDNSLNMTTLIDATKTGTDAWVANEWAGCTVLITKGAGASERQPWRTIISNTATTLTVSTVWETAHNTSTEYVILGSNKYKYKASINGAGVEVADVAVAGDIVYFARNLVTSPVKYPTSTYVLRYSEYNLDGVWTLSTAAESVALGNKLFAINTPSGWTLWGSQDDNPKHGACVWKGQVPKNFSSSADLYNLVEVLDDGKKRWDEYVATGMIVDHNDDGATISTEAVAGASKLLCSKTVPPTDITDATKIGLLIKSSVVTAATDLDLMLDGTQLLGRNYLPNKVWHYDTEVLPNEVVWRKAYSRPTSVLYLDGGGTDGYNWLPLSNLFDGTSTYGYKMSYDYDPTAALCDYIFVSYPERMSALEIDMGTTKNDVVSTMKIEYWDGDGWATVTGFVDGTKPGSISLAQSGYVSWTVPDDWQMGVTSAESTIFPYASYLAQDRYHLRISWGVDLKTGVDLARITAHGNGYSEAPESRQFVSLKNVFEESDKVRFTSPSMVITNKDAIYICSTKRFNTVKIDRSGTQNNVGTLAGYYWTGDGWVDASIADGTESPAGTTLGKDGVITFTLPVKWARGCDAWLQEFLTNDYYVLCLIVTVTDASKALDTITLNNIRLEDSSTEDIFEWQEMNNVKDGDPYTIDYLTITDDDYIYILHSTKYNKVYWNLTGVNAVDTTMAAQYFNGNGWVTLAHDANDWHDETEASAGHTTLSKSGAMYFALPYDWQQISIGEETGYAIRFAPYADLTPEIKIAEIYVQDVNAITLSIPAMAANIWYYHELDLSSETGNLTTGDKTIVSIGLYRLNDIGAQIITVGGVEVISETMKYFKLGNDRINSIEAYGDVVMNPWVFTESLVYEIQTQNDDSIVAMPLREIMGLRSETNGAAHTVSDVYLVFNLGQYIEKYYQHNLDDIGPNRDEGLPITRQGNPSCLISYPGRIFMSIDAGTTGYSTVMMRREGGWHEIYRGPYGVPIYDMIIQVIPNMSTRLWISQGYDLLWIPLPTNTWNPKNDSKFRYTHESVVTTGWINAGFMDINKFWKSVKLYTENLSGTDQYIKCQYQIEDGDLEDCTDWTDISDTFDTSPYQENYITENYDIIARRIRFRFILVTTTNTEAPILKATIFEVLLRFPVKYSYSINYRIEDEPENYSGRKDSSARAEDVSSRLDAWADAPTVLTFRCQYSPFDNKKVVIEPSSLRPVQIDSDDNLFEKHVASMVLMEV